MGENDASVEKGKRRERRKGLNGRDAEKNATCVYAC